ncbi:(Fe-S)-binding protein [Candidatus Methanoliparum sp. LAM-1]|uniref:(Fe-S)-binding protein n=1 Tax=Candidatus Methanoliparum sp. LAM-1 TaxID=2874846 RepID=UPI001E50611C|nr:(Fe-S)-binding protein [Candidatus Methanoliparum sp. LAM-1]BDC35716.1 Fe-S oxidoreductase [Candidatus Methanoliparum sp. LAM-1]
MMEVEETNFDELYEVYACMQCGKCTGSCAVSLRSDFNIRELMRIAILGNNEDVKEHEEIWDCTSCGICTVRCPRDLKPSEVIVGLRSILVEEGEVPSTIRDALESIGNNNNPWGRPKSKRADWMKDLDVEVKNLSEGDEAEYLLYIGCTASYDTRIQKVSRAAVHVLTKLGVDFGVLGEEEPCCGSEARMMGESGLFEMLVEDNMNLFKDFGISKIITLSPHAYNTFTTDYKDYKKRLEEEGIEIPNLELDVKHYTQFLAELIEEGRLTSDMMNEFNKTVVYHDPCYLGKRNNIFNPPRKVLSIIPGINLVEFERREDRSLCCEGAGGRMWSEGTGTGERNAVIRVRDANALNAEIIAVACPFCLSTLEDGRSTAGYEESMEVKDIFEILDEVLK